MANPILPESVTCPHCGTSNRGDRALCANCQSPLTAYGGQLKGHSETESGRFARQAAGLYVRPPAVYAAVAFDALFAVFWPLAYVLGAFAARERVNAELTNYLASAFGAIGPILSAIVLIPAALVILLVAWGAWSQQPWAWSANLGVIGVFALAALFKYGAHPAASIVWLIVACVLAAVWTRPATKSWYGMN